jgi:uridine kinase
MKDGPAPIRQVIKRDGQVVPYDRDRIATAIFKAAAAVGGRDRAQAEALAREVERRLAESYGGDLPPTVEDIQDIVEETLIAQGHVRTARAYIIYRHERAKARAARAAVVEATDNIPYKTIYEVLRWNMDHGCETIDGLNRIVSEGRLPDLIRASEERYHEEVRQAARRMVERRPELRLVIVAGPSSSGKTTTTIKVGEALRAEGCALKTLNLDHYFFDLEQHPRDEFGDYDYETPQALDLELINRHLAELIEGRTIRTPHYDFHTGRRRLDVHEMRLEAHELLLIDSLHGLYEGMTGAIPATTKFRLYIETLGQIRNREGLFMRWADHRLMRRMVRDQWHRNHQPLQTIAHWHYVRASEMKHIIPFIRSADYILNSALPYELPFLKARLFSCFEQAAALYRDDARRQDAYIRARRVRDLLEPLIPVEDARDVPPNSLFREFIGGSCYVY